MTIPRTLCTASTLVLLAAGLRAQEPVDTRSAATRTSTFGAEYTIVAFREDLDPWHLASLSHSQRTAKGSVIGRVNIANRFATSGAQVEVDAYPRLGSSTYAYVSVGYSGSSIYPEWRSGAEIFTSLPQAWEASAGYRQLRFGGAPVTLFTGAVGRYVGNYWFSIRPYVRNSSSGTSASASLTTRRYYEDADHFIGGRVGYGSAPPDQFSPDVASLSRESSFSASVQGSGDLTRRLLGTWSLGYDREELTATRTRTGFTAATGLRVRL